MDVSYFLFLVVHLEIASLDYFNLIKAFIYVAQTEKGRFSFFISTDKSYMADQIAAGLFS